MNSPLDSSSITNSKKLLLLDGDIIAFQCLCKCNFELNLHSDNNSHFIHKMVNFDEACYTAKHHIENIKKDLNTDSIVFCFTDSETGNFRKGVYSAYKSNRLKLSQDKPLGLRDLINFLSSEYESKQQDLLEADDVMGILATDPNYEPDYTKIIVSEDKDLKTIPGWLYNPRKDITPRYIPLDEANRYLAYQCIAGDIGDGYSGCPGIGMATAEQLIANKVIYQQENNTMRSGKNKGKAIVRWKKVEGMAKDYWSTIKSCYEKTGLTKEEAIANARCARILRYEDYKQNKIKLWEPWKHDF